MNSDRAGSLLCSFQTFQTFMSPGLWVHCATRDTEHLPGGVQPDLQDVVQERAYLVTYIDARWRAWATPLVLLCFLRAPADARFFNTLTICHPARPAQAPSPIREEERASSSLVPHGVPECHSAFPRLGLGPSLITSPLLHLHEPLDGTASASTTIIDRFQPEANHHRATPLPWTLPSCPLASHLVTMGGRMRWQRLSPCVWETTGHWTANHHSSASPTSSPTQLQSQMRGPGPSPLHHSLPHKLVVPPPHNPPRNQQRALVYYAGGLVVEGSHYCP